MVGLLRPHVDSAPVLVPLLPDDVPALRRPATTAFTTQALREHLAGHPGLAWRASDGADYVVGGRWRQREDIGTIEELAGRRRAPLLLDRLLASHASAGRRLALVSQHEADLRERFYLGQGFEPIDSIVRMERPDRPVPRELPATGASLRAYEEADCAAVLDAERHSFDWLWWNSAAELSAYARHPDVRIVVAELGGRIVGYSGSTVHRRDGHLDRLAVDRSAQGIGLGRLLLVEALQAMTALGAPWIALTTQVANRQAQALYERFGFVRTPIEISILGRWLGARG